MIKKQYPFILAVLLFSCGFVFSQEQTFSMSAGVGGVFSSVFDIEKVHTAVEPYVMPAAGINIFFDATYVEAGIDVQYGSRYSLAYPVDPANSATALTHLGFSLYGKYPFPLSRITLYPLLGVDFRLFLSGQVYDADGNKFGGKLERGGSVGGGYTAEDQFDMLSLGVGLGLDFPLPKHFFIRSEFIVKYTFDSTVAGDKRDTAKKYDFDYVDVVLEPCIKIMFGYRFYR
ncbi:MAG: hypothetical protein LBQ48_00080 [Oscillospiraceae bacterium]|nr:hypothetical protein [Oscillospiraceae bacterium]